MTIREQIEKREQEILSPFACLSINSRGRDYDEPQCDIRPVFQRDRDRILHSKAFRRLKIRHRCFLRQRAIITAHVCRIRLRCRRMPGQ